MDAVWPSKWPKIAEKLHIFDLSGNVLLILKRRLEKNIVEYVDRGRINKPSSLRVSKGA
jgi:hypothetical protein